MPDLETQTIDHRYEAPAVEDLATDGPATVCGIVSQQSPPPPN